MLLYIYFTLKNYLILHTDIKKLQNNINIMFEKLYDTTYIKRYICYFLRPESRVFDDINETAEF